MCADNFRMGVIQNRQTVLVVCFIDTEHAEVGKKCLHTAYRHRTADRGRVVFLDAALEKLIRKLLRKRGSLDARLQVAVKHCQGRRPGCSGVRHADIQDGVAPGAAVVGLFVRCIRPRRTGLYPHRETLPVKISHLHCLRFHPFCFHRVQVVFHAKFFKSRFAFFFR